MTIPSYATVYDQFHTTAANGWPTSTSGHTWTVLGAGGTLLASDWNVTASGAHHSVPAAGAYRFSAIANANLASVDLSAAGSVAVSSVTGAPVELIGLMFRYTDSTHYYLARIDIQTNMTMTLTLFGYGAAGTQLASVAGILSGLAYTSGLSLTMRAAAYESQLRVKVWKTSDPEPGAWTIVAYDTGSLAAGGVGVRTGVTAGNTTTKPIVSTFTEFWAGPRQRGRTFIPAILGANTKILTEAAFGADLSDADGSNWDWTDATVDQQDTPGTSATVSRGDNVSQAGAAAFGCTLGNSTGNYTAGNPAGTLPIAQNTPIRQRITLDGTNWFTRFQGYADSFNPTTDQSAKVKAVSVTALGMLGRLAGRKKPLKSPLYRAMSTIPNLLAYWPMEDGDGATSAAPAVGTSPLTVSKGSSAPTFGADGPAGGAAAIDFSNNVTMIGRVPSGSNTSWRIAFAWSYIGGALTGSNEINPLYWTTVDGAQWIIRFLGSGAGPLTLNLQYAPPDDTLGAFVQAYACPWVDTDTSWHTLQLTATQNGSDIDVAVAFDDVTWHPSTPTPIFTGFTLAAVSSVYPGRTGPVAQNHAWLMSHLAVASPTVFAPSLTAPDIAQAVNAYTGETADARLARLCAEENIALDLDGTSTVTMGPQSIDTIVNLLRECEAADHGMLYDGLGPGIAYQCRTERYAAAAALTLDMGAAAPEVETFKPIFDRQAIKNLWAVSRKNGQTVPYEKTDGPVGSDTVGVADDSATVNIDTDDPLIFHAGFLVSLGTVPGFRFPGVGLNLRGVAGKADDLLAAGAPGYRLTILNPASAATDLPPDPIDLIVEGWTETTTADTWTLALNTSPYAPWDIGVLDGDARLAAGDASTLTAGINTTATSFQITIASGPLWTTDAGQFPLDVRIDAERITLSAISGASSPQTATVSARHVNGVVQSHLVGHTIEVWHPIILGL